MLSPSPPLAASIEPCRSVEQPGWLTLRDALWPGAPAAEHLAEMAEFLGAPSRFVQFVAYSPSREPIGFVEGSLRHDHVNGTSSSPVAFLEGLYVVAGQRRRGLARLLVDSVAAWGRAAGCRELASDALLENDTSHAAHRGLGFSEVERVVVFRKDLP